MGRENMTEDRRRKPVQKKKKKRGHVAIPFLLAFLLAIGGIGGVAWYLFGKLDGGDNIQIMQSSNKKPTSDQDFTLLLVLDEPGATEQHTFLIARVRPSEREIMFVGMPSNMLSFVDGRQDTLAGFYEKGGIQQAEAAIINEANIDPDRYMIFNSESFQKICNIFAGAYYDVPNGLNGFTDSAEAQYLGPAQMEKLITYPMFEQGEMQRSTVAADLICEMINQTDYDRICASMDSHFKTMINMVKTDISAIDYSDMKSALKYMYTYGNNIAVFRVATGSMQKEDDVFILDSNFYQGVEEFFIPAEDTTLAPNETTEE